MHPSNPLNGAITDRTVRDMLAYAYQKGVSLVPAKAGNRQPVGCVPGQSARQYRGLGPMDFAAFTGTPGGMPMAFVRCYTGTDGQSHFEDQDLLPPDLERSIEQAASSITFTRSANGRFSDWHNAPRRQYAIFLSGGQMEVVTGDGTTRRFGPGDAVLFE